VVVTFISSSLVSHHYTLPLLHGFGQNRRATIVMILLQRLRLTNPVQRELNIY
jgi:hypothetical protein